MDIDITDEPVGYLVVAEHTAGPKKPDAYGEVLHQTAEDAADEVRDLAVRLGLQAQGSTLLVRENTHPAGLAISPDGTTWAVTPRAVRAVTVLDP